MTWRLASSLCPLLLVFSTPSAALVVVVAETSVAAGGSCSDSQQGGSAFCLSADIFGRSVAAADDGFNGGVEIEFVSATGDYSATMAFDAIYRNISPFPEPVRILSILLPGQVQVLGEGKIRMFVGMDFVPEDSSKRLLLAHASEMVSDAFDVTWQNIDLTGQTGASGSPIQAAGKPSNWPDDGAVGPIVALPFSVLGFDFGTVAPGEEFLLSYNLSLTGTSAVDLEFAQANVGDPLNLANGPIFELDRTKFRLVPEPGSVSLLALAVLRLGRRRPWAAGAGSD